ncbi:hypothetical protein Ddye_028450 [Dipteronia dyeriana]|uniref:DNA replication factor RFC1 C-terminal domain-containing protein n=1 Tax=Dipteronia dyeriana TaxID=168575 RepID=A0AAD9TR16_9ROSI|nr:hypothetical protein Ddye_028450 [Dipteronia dyeriana]
MKNRSSKFKVSWILEEELSKILNMGSALRFAFNGKEYEGVKKVVEFMNVYSINQEDFDTIVELSKFQVLYPLYLQYSGTPKSTRRHSVKSALTRAYNEGSKSRMVRAADLVTLPGIKKAPKKQIAAILEPYND